MTITKEPCVRSAGSYTGEVIKQDIIQELKKMIKYRDMIKNRRLDEFDDDEEEEEENV